MRKEGEKEKRKETLPGQQESLDLEWHKVSQIQAPAMSVQLIE